jgi:predicted ribonuclease YlaK
MRSGPAVRRLAAAISSSTNRPDEGIEAIVRAVDGDGARLELARDFRSERHSVWGISARNREQNFASTC